jgi:heavy metal sensor kinase
VSNPAGASDTVNGAPGSGPGNSAEHASATSTVSGSNPWPVRSLRLKLLALYAVVLIGMALLTGVVLFRTLSVSMEQTVDIQLTQRATQLASTVELLPGNRFLIELTEQLSDAFSDADADSGYYCLWDQNGEIIDSSHPDQIIDVPAGPGARDRSPYREITIQGPHGSLILVGRNATPEHVRLREVAGRLGATAAIMITLLLGAGWFLTQRALSPIKRIADAAAAVSLSNLSERIDIASMEVELSDLARTINSTFDRLQKSFNQQSRFRAHASHELRTPLAIVLANVDLALRSERTPQEYQETLRTIRTSAKRMQTIVEGLLSLVQAESGQLKIRRERVSMTEIVESTCRLLGPLADEKQMTIQFSLKSESDHSQLIDGDPDRLTEAVMNLVSNAVHYGNPGTTVDVTLACDRQSTRLSVKNQGHPIPESDHPYLFTPFYRVEGSQQRHSAGCGLGLAITRWIVEAHDGTIAFQSDDHGTTEFTINLPFGRSGDSATSMTESVPARS